MGNRDLIRVAVARDPRQAIPLSGTYFGDPAAYSGMEVSVDVRELGTKAPDGRPGAPVPSEAPEPAL